MTRRALFGVRGLGRRKCKRKPAALPVNASASLVVDRTQSVFNIRLHSESTTVGNGGSKTSRRPRKFDIAVQTIWRKPRACSKRPQAMAR
jgi:hypothetical protein